MSIKFGRSDRATRRPRPATADVSGRKGRLNSQKGQAIVIVAGALLAMFLLLALILMSGLLFFDRRDMQGVADAVALRGAQDIPCVNDSSVSTSTMQTYMTNWFAVAATPLGPADSAVSVSGSCSSQFTGTVSFDAGQFTGTITYPYQGSAYVVAANFSQTQQLSFSAFTGHSSAAPVAHAAALGGTAGASGAFALFTNQVLSCTGSENNVVSGDVYSGGGIQVNRGAGGCTISAEALPDPPVSGQTPTAYGNIFVYPDPGAAQPLAVPTNGWENIYADGFEVQGHTSIGCGIVGTNDYATGPNDSDGDDTGIPAGDPNPCGIPGFSVPAPSYFAFNFAEPNISQPYSTSTPSPDCPGTVPAPKSTLPATINGSAVTVTVYHPGCYSSLTEPRGGVWLFAPGLYYFSGDLTVPDGARLYGADVTLEFAGTSSNMLAQHTVTSACGPLCGYGASNVAADQSSTNVYPLVVPAGAPGCHQISGSCSYTYFSAPGTYYATADLGLTSANSYCATVNGVSQCSTWCDPGTTTSPLCPDFGMLVYGGPISGGSSAGTSGVFGLKGGSAASNGAAAWMAGTVFWPNGYCDVSANAGGNIQGEVICNNAQIQGGVVGGGYLITYNANTVASPLNVSRLDN